MNIVYFGTSKFAVPILTKLFESEHKVFAVVTTPDRPFGRGLEIKSSPIKEFAKEKSIHTLEPENLTDYQFMRDINALAPDIIVVAAYGKKISNEIIALPRFKTINVHPSLLPRYRGASPIQTAILNGDSVTGVTIALVTEKMDAGPILARREIKIPGDATAGELETILEQPAAQLLLHVIEQIKNGTAREFPQDNRFATITRKFTSNEARINWTLDTNRLYNFVRAFLPEPGPFTFYKGSRLKILKIKPILLRERHNFQPGTITLIDNDSFHVATRGGCVAVLQVHPENKKPMSAQDFINGYRVKVSDALG